MTINLSAGEQVLFEGHPSWRSILGFYIKGILITGVLAAITYFVTDLTDDNDSGDWGITTIVLVAGAALTLLIGFIKRVATSYTITNRRLHIKRGIVSREIQETRLERVQNVNYHQSVYQRMMQIGDVDFDTAAGDDYNFIFTGVANPEEVVERVDRATHHANASGIEDLPERPAT